MATISCSNQLGGQGISEERAVQEWLNLSVTLLKPKKEQFSQQVSVFHHKPVQQGLVNLRIVVCQCLRSLNCAQHRVDCAATHYQQRSSYDHS